MHTHAHTLLENKIATQSVFIYPMPLHLAGCDISRVKLV